MSILLNKKTLNKEDFSYAEKFPDEYTMTKNYKKSWKKNFKFIILENTECLKENNYIPTKHYICGYYDTDFYIERFVKNISPCPCDNNYGWFTAEEGKSIKEACEKLGEYIQKQKIQLVPQI